MTDDRMVEDAVIADVIGTLKKPEDYVCEVLARMIRCNKEHGAALVRIGVTGRGIIPNYAIEYPNNLGGTEVFAAFNGANHSQMEDLGTFLDELDGKPSPDRTMNFGNWSTRAMTLQEVQILLGEIRKPRRSK